MATLSKKRVVGNIDGIRVPTDNILLPLSLETIFVGAFTCLIIISTYLLACRGIRDRPSLFMLITTLLMYTFSTTHWVLYMDQALCALKHTCVPFRVHAQQVAVQVVIPINFLLSDAIIIWRTWLIWERRSFVLIIAAPLLLATAATSLVNVVLLPNDAFLLPTIIQSFAGSWAGFAALALTLVTNLWTTMLVAYRAWRHRRDLRAVLQQAGRRSAAERILTLLVESGSIYCTVWILHMIADAGVLGIFGVIVSTCTVQITGLYPTIIVVLVCLHKTSEDSTMSAIITPKFPTHSEIVFASVSGAPSPGSRFSHNRISTLLQPPSSASNNRLSTFLHIRPRSDSFDSLGISNDLLSLVRTKSEKGERSGLGVV